MSTCSPYGAIGEKIKDILYPNRSNDNYWNSGGYAPQYIQLEFEREQSVSQIRLQVAQTPKGHTSHKLLAGPQVNELKEVKALAGFTSDHQWINMTFNPPLKSVRFLRINTITSLSWVAWFKVLVYKN